MAATIFFILLALVMVAGSLYTALHIWKNGCQLHTTILLILLLLALLFVVWLAIMVLVVGPHMRNM